MKQHKLLTFICTWFGTGLFPFAHGTWGSLFTLPFVYFINLYYGMIGVLIFIAAVTLLGFLTAGKLADYMNLQDPRIIVIDEVAGQACAVLVAGTNLWLYLIGFVLFRIFDVLKPWPVSYPDEKMEGAKGIMLDDIVAGIMAGIIVWLVKTYLF